MRYLILIIGLCSTQVYADSNSLNLAIPQTQQSYQSDRIRAGDLDCSNAIGSSTNIEFGVVGIISNNDNPYNNPYGVTPDLVISPEGNQVKDVGVYAKITIPIGAPKERINCNTLYKLELEKKRLEVQKLKAELANLRNLQFED
jgi:hypothetical protein